MLLFGEGGEGSHSGNHEALYLLAGTASPVRLGDLDGADAFLSPDGKWVLAPVQAQSGWKLNRLPTGTGEAQTIAPNGIEPQHAQWFPDGKRILVTGRAPGRPFRQYAMDLDRRTMRSVTPEGIDGVVMSPDGERVLQENFEPPLIFPVSGGDPVPLNGDLQGLDRALGWSADGRSIFAGGVGMPGRIMRLDLATGRRETLKELVPADTAGAQQIIPVRITPDGRYYVYTYFRRLSDLYLADRLR